MNMKIHRHTQGILRTTAVVFGVLTGLNTFAYKYVGSLANDDDSENAVGNYETRAAGCAPAAELTQLEFNNVRALIETGGSMWQDRSTSRASYIVPKDGNVSALYAGALWMGGISPDQQLKLAAVRFRTEGNDYWAGPLTLGSAEIDATTCAEYDRFFPVSKADVERHRQYFDCLNDPQCDLEAEFGENPYAVPEYFRNWPALYQGNTLAPWYDYDDDGDYDPDKGDYPWYDLFQDIDCFERVRTDPIPLFGDFTIWWVFNDKGNVHSESQGQPIGMEIRAQAFAFSGNDEINNMTFYNYTVINQGTQILQNTYFGQWVDPDLGTATDDYVGCDVQRGLGYCYNGDAVDESSSSSPGYGENPPAVGIDFFQGPFQDDDGIDNPLTTDFSSAIDSLGIPYEGIGIGYGDGIIDNERYGMRKFLYYNNSSGLNGEPSTALHYYNYMQGFWKNGQRMAYGGDGFTTSSGADLGQPADYMFPGTTDPFHWGTVGNVTEPWTEVSSGNPPGDRRFIQSAGPFTLEPGAYNNITVGVVWARASSGDPLASVDLVRLADDKAQALFDNCFQVVSGPDAPDVAIRELDQEVILYLTNDNPISNNFREEYIQFDPGIPPVLEDGTELDTIQRSYTFQGYLIYQLSDSEVSVADLEDVDKARLVAQCDVRDSVDVIVNYTRDEVMGVPVPELMVDGENNGILHSFRITNDAFALGDPRLVNFKTYYFLVLAYGYNNYRDFNPITLNGQDEQFKASRKAAVGSIRVFSAIPHKTNPENGGTVLNSVYGNGVIITRHEGKGNGFGNMEISAESEAEILQNNFAESLVYKRGLGPVDIKVVDPLRLPQADFELRLATDDADLEDGPAFWELENLGTGEIYNSSKPIDVLTEELILEWGLSITWEQVDYVDNFTEPVFAEIEFKDPSRPWLLGVPDQEGFSELNWIRAGTQEAGDDAEPIEIIYNDYKPGNPLDAEEAYEGLLGGTWAPYALCAYAGEVDGEVEINVAPTKEGLDGDLSPFSGIADLNNVDVVFTSDKSKWTRCAVLEAQYTPELSQDLDGNNNEDPEKMRLRRHPSVDKNGRKAGDAGYNDAEGTLNGAQQIGMGWFPGYAIDVGTGERLNMAFAEDSWLGSQNGRDMIWNPSSELFSGIGGQVYAGGQHWIYVFKNSRYEEDNENRMPAYDMGDFLYQNLEADLTSSNQRRVFRSCTWVGSSLLNPDYSMLPIEQGLIPNDVRVKLRIAKAYEKYAPTQQSVENYDNAENFWNPLYTFTTRDISATTGSTAELENFLDNILVVPNPYYAYSFYEQGKVDNRIKIINLPEECVVTIYTVNGTLIRQFNKADPLTFLDWDLKNYINVPISSGVYIIHVEVPGVGETILKWFGVMRPVDLDNF